MFLRKGIVILQILVYFTVSGQDDEGYSSYSKFLNEEGRLLRHLLNASHYEPLVRPAVSEDSPATQVQFGLELVQLIGINEEEQVVQVHVWLKKYWNDTRLTWNPDDFGGVKHIRIPINKIWRPDLVLVNGAFEEGDVTGFGKIYETMALVFSRGAVMWFPPAKLKATCQLDVSNFPFDKQYCQMKFVSWTYSSKYLDPQFYGGYHDFDHSRFLKSNVWNLESTMAKKNDTKYECCPDSYPDLTFFMELSRVRSYSSYMLVLPGVVLTFLLPVMFLLPVGRPEKFHLGCSLLVCLTLMSLLVEMMIPTAHSAVPFIEMYYLGNFIITGIALAVSATILNISRLKSQPPVCLKKIVELCAKCCCINLPGHTYRNYRIQMNPSSDESSVSMETDGSQVTPNADWGVIATIIDRLFLVCSLVVAIFTTIGMLSHS